MLTLEFKGARELEAALMELTTATAKNVARRALKKAGEPVRAKAESLAPEAEGDLEKAVSISTKARRHRAAPGTVEVYIGVATDEGQVGALQEFGNINHSAQPFMRPAWHPMRFQVLNEIGANMMIEVEKSAARARRKAMKG
jgi:HK97 gp10 family phage protein